MADNYHTGLGKPPGYWSWQHMLKRCSNSTHKNYADYGGRGIKVCERWQSFKNFYADMGERPEGMSIDRIDNNGNYEPSNCRWATPKEQANNRRNSRLLSYNGKSKTINEWSVLLGIKSKTIYARLNDYGWSVERALGA